MFKELFNKKKLHLNTDVDKGIESDILVLAVIAAMILSPAVFTIIIFLFDFKYL